MIEEEALMTVRENVHQLVDTLPEDCLADVLDYLADLDDTNDIGAETEAAIREGLEDIRAGRTLTIQEYRRTAAHIAMGRTWPLLNSTKEGPFEEAETVVQFKSHATSASATTAITIRRMDHSMIPVRARNTGRSGRR
jgi:hypothetical protein